MSTVKTIEILFKEIEKVAGPIQAKHSVSDVLSIAISRLQDEGSPVTEENLGAIISNYTDDFIEAAKKEVA